MVTSPVQRTGRVLPHTSPSTVTQLLDLSQHVVACFVVHVDPLGVSTGLVGKTVGVDF
jgi:hypothetical protein